MIGEYSRFLREGSPHLVWRTRRCKCPALRAALGARFADKPRFVSKTIGRRAFVARAIAIGTMWRTTAWRIASAPVLRIGMVSPSEDENSLVMLGARLGAEEASHSATLFGAGGV